MTSTRPRRRASWAALTDYRVEPAGGTESTGYGAAACPTAGEWNWQIGYLSEWAAYSDLTRHADLADPTAVQRVTDSALSFSIGAGLSQRPNTGGVYIVGGVRLDAADTSATAPVYNFTANTTNYVWLKEPSSTARSNYADRLVTTDPGSPGAGYAHVRTVTCGPTTVTVDIEPNSVVAGFTWRAQPHYFTAQVNIEPSTGDRALRLVGPNVGSETVLILPPSNTYTAPFIKLLPNAAGVGIEAQVSGTGSSLGPAYKALLDSKGCAVYGTTTNPFAAGLCTVYSELYGTGFDIALAPAPAPPTAPTVGDPLYGRLLMYSEALTSGGGLRWLEPTAGAIRQPFASRDGAVFGQTIGANTGLLTSGAVTTLVTSAVYTFRRSHTYLIIAQAETDWTTSPAFSVTVDVRVNGVSVAPAPHAVNPCTISGPNITRPWLNGTYYYLHSVADVSATVTLRTTHGAAGAGNVRYNNPRLTVLGAFAS